MASLASVTQRLPRSDTVGQHIPTTPERPNKPLDGFVKDTPRLTKQANGTLHQVKSTAAATTPLQPTTPRLTVLPNANTTRAAQAKEWSFLAINLDSYGLITHGLSILSQALRASITLVIRQAFNAANSGNMTLGIIFLSICFGLWLASYCVHLLSGIPLSVWQKKAISKVQKLARAKQDHVLREVNIGNQDIFFEIIGLSGKDKKNIKSYIRMCSDLINSGFSIVANLLTLFYIMTPILTIISICSLMISFSYIVYTQKRRERENMELVENENSLDLAKRVLKEKIKRKKNIEQEELNRTDFLNICYETSESAVKNSSFKDKTIIMPICIIPHMIAYIYMASLNLGLLQEFFICLPGTLNLFGQVVSIMEKNSNYIKQTCALRNAIQENT